MSSFVEFLLSRGRSRRTAATYARLFSRYREAGSLDAFFARYPSASPSTLRAALLAYASYVPRARWVRRDADLLLGRVAEERRRAAVRAFSRPPPDPSVLEDLSGLSGEEVTAVFLGALAGLRCSDILSARWADVDFERRRLLLPNPKGGRPYVVPLAEPLYHHLRLRHEVLSPAPEDRLAPVGRDRFRALLRERGLRPHDLRRLFATRLLSAGRPFATVARLLNHRSIETTMRYFCPQESEMVAAMEVFRCAK